MSHDLFTRVFHKIQYYLDEICDTLKKENLADYHFIEIRTTMLFTETNPMLITFIDSILETAQKILSHQELDRLHYLESLDFLLHECSDIVSEQNRCRATELCQLLVKCLSYFSTMDILIKQTLSTIAVLYSLVSLNEEMRVSKFHQSRRLG